MLKLIKSYAKQEEGATAIEYGLMAAAISVAIIATVVLLGPALDGVFQRILAAIGLV